MVLFVWLTMTQSFMNICTESIKCAQSEGLLEVQNDHIRLTRTGKPLVDSVAVALLGDVE